MTILALALASALCAVPASAIDTDEERPDVAPAIQILPVKAPVLKREPNPVCEWDVEEFCNEDEHVLIETASPKHMPCDGKPGAGFSYYEEFKSWGQKTKKSCGAAKASKKETDGTDANPPPPPPPPPKPTLNSGGLTDAELREAGGGSGPWIQPCAGSAHSCFTPPNGSTCDLTNAACYASYTARSAELQARDAAHPHVEEVDPAKLAAGWVSAYGAGGVKMGQETLAQRTNGDAHLSLYNQRWLQSLSPDELLAWAKQLTGPPGAATGGSSNGVGPLQGLTYGQAQMLMSILGEAHVSLPNPVATPVDPKTLPSGLTPAQREALLTPRPAGLTTAQLHALDSHEPFILENGQTLDYLPTGYRTKFDPATKLVTVYQAPDLMFALGLDAKGKPFDASMDYYARQAALGAMTPEQAVFWREKAAKTAAERAALEALPSLNAEDYQYGGKFFDPKANPAAAYKDAMAAQAKQVAAITGKEPGAPAPAAPPKVLANLALPTAFVARAANCVPSQPETCAAKTQLDAARDTWYSLHAPGAKLAARDRGFLAAVKAGYVKDTSEGMAAWNAAGSGGLGDAANQTYQYFLNL
jgi:hypothetical protein